MLVVTILQTQKYNSYCVCVVFRSTHQHGVVFLLFEQSASSAIQVRSFTKSHLIPTQTLHKSKTFQRLADREMLLASMFSRYANCLR